MTSLPAGLELRPLTVPDRIDAADASDFREMSRVRNLVYAEVSGHTDHDVPADELLGMYRPDPSRARFTWVAVWHGRVVGRVGLDLPQEDGARTAMWLIELLREAWGHGIGRAAFDLVERAARAHGRRVLQSWAEHPAADGPRLGAPTGFGSIPADRAARFLVANGCSLEQIVRVSAYDLTADPARLGALLAEAEVASAGYRVVQWEFPTPPEFVDDFATMKARMVTDAPSADLEYDEETWDATRVRRYEASYVDVGRRVLVTAAQHVDSGELAAFNELTIGKDLSRPTFQEDTLVVASHRGHRLGMLVKCAGLLAWRGIAPDSPRVITYNAEENRPMLSINERIGFIPTSYEGVWKKVLA